MTNPVNNDRNPAQHLLRDQKTVTNNTRGDEQPTRRPADPDQTPADLARANERLAIEKQADPSTRIGSADAARERIAALRQMLGADPGAALAAHGRVGGNSVDAVLNG